ncbi:hypothetical protein IMX26_17570 [Clostridium sp. 'deep sea']|uniref:PEP/pyruvate-binding domain-containing protein n=1 Tax=Clostridium sp. 'deep sea' TaxID=2779445 RepID=UPI0018967B15|nr:PEP/pyruvate-binding domain-containing protein [Clostridium sp. 'deep sea']QOR35239.1 hypothetical protein IMX26_17570 [Clostridium sp. 'deep sea']
MIYYFNEKKIPELSQVGGKAKALIETTNAGFPVPEGITLSVDFFSTWLNTIKSSNEFKAVIQNTTKENCDAVKALAEVMNFNEWQSESFNKTFTNLQGNIFAVRSSSPEEDLEGTSFAGMYETYLGTNRSEIEKTVARAFSSCFDYRVMRYKKQNAIDLNNTSIAVIIQKQIDSEMSGVGFSLNPLNNCYDEVVINASLGLGEAIVSGIVTPDMYIYDAVDKRIIDKKISKKEIAIYLKEDGGTVKKEILNKEKQTLTDNQIVELSSLIKKVEEYYNKPVDTEWAYEKDKLYLLQARPITSYLPFFEELLTKPGEKKRFYLDLMVMTQGFDEPMSVLGMEVWSEMLYNIKFGMMTPQAKGTTPALYGREYISVTDLQKIVGKKNVMKMFNSYDGNVKRIFNKIDLDAHFPNKKPEGVKGFKRKAIKMFCKMLPGVFKGIFLNYKAVIKDYNEIADDIINRAKNLKKEDSFKYNASQISQLLMETMGTISAMFAGMLAQSSIKKMFKGEDIEKEIIALAMDLEGNPTSAMGHLLVKMASYEEFQNTASRQEFIKKCKDRNYSKEFMADYNEFMDKYAVRGMKEIDIASLRIYEDIGLLYVKLIEINIEDNQIIKVKEKRQQAYNKLLKAAKAKGKEKKFIKAANKYQATFGYREHPKYVIVYILAMLHNICLQMANEWVKEGRLEEPYHIFDLHVNEIAKAQKDANFNMKAARVKNLKGYQKVAHVKNWPLVIDSRGKIYKPKMQIKDGDIVGDPIAPGKVVGKAKVLKSPYEKPLYSGEILITRATEPSWTPIFINAAGVIMEIGGPLQHGGIIAREYGIPCVSGLIGIMDMVKDGDLIEVDGYNGIVKILEK